MTATGDIARAFAEKEGTPGSIECLAKVTWIRDQFIEAMSDHLEAEIERGSHVRIK